MAFRPPLVLSFIMRAQLSYLFLGSGESLLVCNVQSVRPMGDFSMPAARNSLGECLAMPVLSASAKPLVMGTEIFSHNTEGGS